MRVETVVGRLLFSAEEGDEQKNAGDQSEDAHDDRWDGNIGESDEADEDEVDR